MSQELSAEDLAAVEDGRRAIASGDYVVMNDTSIPCGTSSGSTFDCTQWPWVNPGPPQESWWYYQPYYWPYYNPPINIEIKPDESTKATLIATLKRVERLERQVKKLRRRCRQRRTHV